MLLRTWTQIGLTFPFLIPAPNCDIHWPSGTTRAATRIHTRRIAIETKKTFCSKGNQENPKVRSKGFNRMIPSTSELEPYNLHWFKRCGDRIGLKNMSLQVESNMKHNKKTPWIKLQLSVRGSVMGFYEGIVRLYCCWSCHLAGLWLSFRVLSRQRTTFKIRAGGCWRMTQKQCYLQCLCLQDKTNVQNPSVDVSVELRERSRSAITECVWSEQCSIYRSAFLERKTAERRGSICCSVEKL